MTLRYIRDIIIPGAMDLLPYRMDTDAAVAMLLAIGLQESRFRHRRQLSGGPAHGFWQFEQGGGVVGVMQHHTTRVLSRMVWEGLSYPPEDYQPRRVWDALVHNDILAAAFARLLLWTDYNPLPARDEHFKGWVIYNNVWRPGKPHEATWREFYEQAWDAVSEEWR